MKTLIIIVLPCDPGLEYDNPGTGGVVRGDKSTCGRVTSSAMVTRMGGLDRIITTPGI